MRRFLLYSVGGALGLFTDAGILALLFHFGASPFWARLPSFLTAVWITWLWNHHYTFRDRKTREVNGRFVHYLATQSLGLSLNFGVYSLLLLVPLLRHHPLVPLFVSSALAWGFNWVSADRWVFRKPAP